MYVGNFVYFCSMKINTSYKVRNVAGENIVLLQGKMGGDMTRVVAFNETALLLWNELFGKDFTLEDATRVLTEHYDVDETTAAVDAERWIQDLRESQLLIAEA